MNENEKNLDSFVKDYHAKKPTAEPAMIAADATISSLWAFQAVTCQDVFDSFERLHLKAPGPAPRPMKQILDYERQRRNEAKKRFNEKAKAKNKGERMTHRTAEEKQAILELIRSSETRNPKELMEAVVKAEIVTEPIKLSYVKYMIAQAGKPSKKTSKRTPVKDIGNALAPFRVDSPKLLNLGQGFGLQVPAGTSLSDIRYLSLKFCKRGDGLCAVESVLSYEHIPTTDPE